MVVHVGVSGGLFLDLIQVDRTSHFDAWCSWYAWSGGCGWCVPLHINSEIYSKKSPRIFREISVTHAGESVVVKVITDGHGENLNSRVADGYSGCTTAGISKVRDQNDESVGVLLLIVGGVVSRDEVQSIYDITVGHGEGTPEIGRVILSSS